MIVALPVHLVAVIVWLGGLFLLTVILRSPGREQAMAATISVWYGVLSKFFVWGSLSLLAIIGSGIAIVHLRFGGFSGVPTIHRLNMIVGIPAIGIYAYAQAVPWRACRRAVAGSDWGVAKKSISRVHALFVMVLIVGLVASIVSGAARVALEA